MALVHKLEQLEHNSAQELPVCTEEPWILSNDWAARAKGAGFVEQNGRKGANGHLLYMMFEATTACKH